MASKDSAALLWLTSGMTTFDAYSTLNSSPWTAESFGADAERAASLREYIKHAVVFSMFYALVGAVIILRDPDEDNSNAWYPVVGAALANVYLVWLYRRASARGAVAGHTNWAGNGG